MEVWVQLQIFFFLRLKGSVHRPWSEVGGAVCGRLTRVVTANYLSTDAGARPVWPLIIQPGVRGQTL